MGTSVLGGVERRTRTAVSGRRDAMKGLPSWREGTGGALDALRHEVEGLFERFLREPAAPAGGGEKQGWSPAVDVEETDREVVVKADLPGVDPKDVDVTVTEGTLVLRGERREERKEMGKTSHRTERPCGRFYREVRLPAGIDRDGIAATG